MKASTPLIVALGGFLAGVSTVFAGGNTSVVHLKEVHAIEVEAGKVTIVGTGYVEFRVMTNRESAASSVFGQPAQLVSARTTGGTFEIIPYFSDPEIKGVPTGGHDADELKKMSARWWKVVKAKCEKIRPGDQITIGYQQDRITLTEFQIEGIIGAGSVTINEKVKTKEQGRSEQADPAPKSKSEDSGGNEAEAG